MSEWKTFVSKVRNSAIFRTFKKDFLNFIGPHKTSYNFIRLHATSYDFIQLLATSYDFLRLHTTSYDFIQLHTTSYDFLLHATSYDFMRLLTTNTHDPYGIKLLARLHQGLGHLHINSDIVFKIL